MDAGLATMLFVLVVSLTAVQSQILKEPVNVLKKVDDNVTLECVTRSRNCDGVDWVKMEGAQSSKTVYRSAIGILAAFPRERYSVNSSGGCSLTIGQLQISDSGRFTCSQFIGDKQETRGCVLVAIDVTESCRSNVTSNALNQNDSYSFSTTINVPAKSVEPSNVILSFHNKAVDETETMNGSQPQTVNATLTGIARKTNITQRVCRASLPPNSADGFDRSIATLDVCITQPLIVSYPVENIAVSSSPYYKGAMVCCTADGHPYPTFKWTHLMSGDIFYGDTLVITGEAGDQYKCTATNIINGKFESQNATIEVSSGSSCGSNCIAGIIIMFIIVTTIIILVVIWLVCWRRKQWPFMLRLPFLSKKDGKTCKKENAGEPLPDIMPINEPAKPPKANDPAPNRPPSECNYAELQFEPKPQQIMKPNLVNDSSTVYASVTLA